MEELKRCPFCGAKPPQIGLFGYGMTYFVMCNNCGVETSDAISEEKAIEAWNKRYKED
jgi:Lar family restriction alleviation protein